MNNPVGSIRYIEEIPSTYRNVFQEYPCFNTVQSRVLEDALQTDHSLVVSAPTGSGKTAIFEMAIVRLLMINEENGSLPNTKMIYISPIKALCTERLIDWHKKFANYGIKCISLTSDTDDFDARNISHYNLIISTPEKWDVVTRRWRDNQQFIAAINLFMIDEVHLLNADTRGSTLEVIVSRMKTAESFLLLSQKKNKIRFIALSATIPNVEDIAEWIEPSGIAKYFKFLEDTRPVKLDKVVYGFNFSNKSAFKFDLSLNYKLPNLISKYSKGKPTLIFCSTRKSVEITTNHLVTNLQIRLSSEQKQVLNQISGQINDVKLRQFIVHGIAFHHAGLIPENRNIIESSFREGHLPILVTTSTLAMGVNLPAHLVIVKGTKRYTSNEGYKDYDEVSIFQMIGRAGRSQFDTSATALILTTIQDKIKYEQMVNCTQKIESNLHKHLTEHLNAEIVLRTITDLEVAMNWLTSTFLYVRARKCPEKYKLPAGLSREKIDKKLLEICQIDLNKLVRAGMIKMNQAIEVAPTVVGEIMAKYYIAFNTMELFTKISGNEIMIQILALISKCQEFSEIHLRSNDKKCLNLLNKNTYKESIRFPLTGKIKTVDMKINCIIQAVLGNLDIPDQSILNDSIRVMRNCERLANCLIEYLETRTKCYNALLNTIILAKCFHVKLWENSPYVSKQLTGVGQVISTLLAKAGKTTFKEIIDTNPRHIELIVGRKAPFGNNLIDGALHLPQYQMTLKKVDNNVELVINLLNPKILEDNPTVNLGSKMTLLVGDDDNNILLYEKYAHSYMLDHPMVTRSIQTENPNLTFLTADLISEDWVGIDCSAKLQLLFKPTDVASQITKTTSNKTNKQTFIDMYMKGVKKDNTTRKKSEARTLPKKNTLFTEESQSELIPKSDNNYTIKERNHDNLIENEIKNDDGSMSLKTKKHKTMDGNFCNDKDKNSNKLNESCSQSTWNSYLDPKNPELNSTSTSQGKKQNSEKTDKKENLVSKSIFRTKSKSESSKMVKSRSKYTGVNTTENASIYNTLLTDSLPREPKLSQPQNSALISKLKHEKPVQSNIQNQLLDKSHVNIYENTFLEDLFSYKSQISTFKKSVSDQGKSQTKNGGDMKRINSEELFPSESQINAIMDDFEKNNFCENNKRELNNQSSNSSDNMNIFKNSNHNVNQDRTKPDIAPNRSKHDIDKMCFRKKSDSYDNRSVKNVIVDCNIHNQCSPTYCDNKNINSTKVNVLEEFLPSQYQANPVLDKHNMEQIEPKQKTNIASFKYLNNYLDDNNCNKEKENKNKGKNHGFHISLSSNCYDESKVNSLNKTSNFTNNDESNIFSSMSNVKHNAEKSGKNGNFEKSRNNLFLEEIRDFKLYNDLCEKYNLETKSKNENADENNGPNQIFPIEKKKNVQETRNKNMKATMNYSYSAVNQSPFQRENFLTQHPKRCREIEKGYFSSFEESQPKRIKWRSPLVHTPPEKLSIYSRNFPLDRTLNSKEDTKDSSNFRLGTQDTSNSSPNLNISLNSQKHSNLTSPSVSTRKKLTFPLCDEDCRDKNDTFYKNIKFFKDFCDLESVGLVNKQAKSQKDSEKNSLHPTFSAGKYYSQLMSSQLKSLPTDPENEKTKDRNMIATHKSTPKPTLCVSQNIHRSPSFEVDFSDPSYMLPHSHFYHYPKPPPNNILSQNIPYQCYEQKHTLQDYNLHVPKEYIHNDCNLRNGKCVNTVETVQQKNPLPEFSSSDDNTHHSIINLVHSPKTFPQKPLQTSNLDDSTHTFQSTPYFSPQQPFRDHNICNHQEILPPYPVPSRYPSSTSFRCPYSGYTNSDPSFRETYPGFVIVPNYAVEHINNKNSRTIPPYRSQIGAVSEDYVNVPNYAVEYNNSKNSRSIPLYHSQIGAVSEGYANVPNYAVEHINSKNLRSIPLYRSQGGAVSEDYVDQCTRKAQQLNNKPLTFTENENNKSEKQPLRHFQQASPYQRKKSEELHNYPLNAFTQANYYEQKNRNPQTTQHNHDNFSFRSEHSTNFNNQSQADNFLHSNSQRLLHNEQELNNLGNNYISQMFSPVPRRQFSHNSNFSLPQSQKSVLHKTPHRHLMSPPSQKQLLNFNSFENRLDNIILSRNQGFTLSATREQQHDRQNNFSATSQQPNEKEFLLNKYLFPNDKK